MGLFDGLLKIGAKALGKIPVIGSTVHKIVSGPLKPVFSLAQHVAHTADNLGVPLARPIASGLDTIHDVAKAGERKGRKFAGQLRSKVHQSWARARRHWQDLDTHIMHPAKRARLTEIGSMPPRVPYQRLHQFTRRAMPYIREAGQQFMSRMRQHAPIQYPRTGGQLPPTRGEINVRRRRGPELY